jgi:hypothetical protein
LTEYWLQNHVFLSFHIQTLKKLDLVNGFFWNVPNLLAIWVFWPEISPESASHSNCSRPQC